MAEFKVKIWRRTAHRFALLKIKDGDVETDEVSVEASDEDAALDQVIKAEYAENTNKRLRVYVQIDMGSRGKGRGDYALMNMVTDEETKRFLENPYE